MSGLKQSVVIVNEFTTKTANGGTRGGTPGDYVLRYMSRDGATEDLTPVRHDAENFIMRYMARSDAVDHAISVDELKSEMRDIQGDGGVAFGYGEFSLSHRKLKAAAKDIQKNFDSGKTVLKTVLSFDQEYLRKYGIISPDFQMEQEGDYRGNIDQMKLRMAIMHGIDNMSRNYDDLQYIGVIQVDTKHVHCHLAMVDRGEGNLMPDGTQRGKITEKEKRAIRRGIDAFLDEKQTVKMMAANVDYDKRNTICFVKKYTHKAMNNRGFSQFLLACLPEDRNLWRASTNRIEMQKPNAIVREYVKELLDLPDSGYAEALKDVDTYARSRVSKEDLDGKKYRELYREGQNRIIEESMNSVYSVLKQIDTKEMTVNTPMLDAMSMPYEDMANEVDSDPMIEFGFKLRSYKSRLDHHKSEMTKYHDAVKDYEKQTDADPASRALYDYLRIEEEYNKMLMAKYQHFLSFIPPEDEYRQGFDELMQYDKRIENISNMRNDRSMTRMTLANAEEYGIKVYDEVDGHLMVENPGLLDEKLQSMRNHYSSMRDDYNQKLVGYGMKLNDDNTFSRSIPYSFDDVKALDIHHLLYDFPYDFPISNDNIDKFVAKADERHSAFVKARDYLVSTGQDDMLSNFPVTDIDVQKSVADRFRSDPTLRTKRETIRHQKQFKKTVRIDYDFYAEQEIEIKNMIKNTINTLQYE